MNPSDQRDDTEGRDRTDAETLQRPGLVLARAREDAHLTRQQLATALHLSVDAVRALEDDDYTTLGAPVFVRGHLRRAALQLKLDPEPLLAAYTTIADLTEPKVIVPERAGETVHSPVGRQLGLLLVLLVATASAIVWFTTVYQPQMPQQVGRGTPTTVTAPIPAAGDAQGEANIEPAAAVATDEVPQDAEVPGEAAASAAVVPDATPPAAGGTSATAASAQDAAPAPAQTTVVAAGPRIPLEVDFIADAWLEVSDAQGRVLHYDLGRAGTHLVLEGVAPLRVFLGDASAVALRSEGFIIDTTPFRRDDHTARFAVDANGMVRGR